MSGKNKRDAPADKRYTIERRWITNKIKKLIKYVTSNPNDKQSAKRLEELVK